MVESVLHSEQDVLIEYNSEKIKVYLDKHPEYEKIAVLLSGDVGFYSGAKKLQETLKERKVRQISGLSSPIYFMAKIGRSWDDAIITSAHGKKENLVELIKTHQKVVSILGTKDAVAFSMYPTSMAELFAVADAGMLMPPKSTWFEPKLRSGLFLHML